jgi:hypothetical protein
MTARTDLGSCLLVLAVGLAGCDGDRRPGPSGPSSVPSPGPQPAPSAGIQLAGTVSDAAWRPLAGARVEVVDGPQTGLSTTTNAKGEYRLMGVFDETTQFRATKEHHVAATWPLPAICDRCNPPWWIHFFLEALAPPANIAGDYTLTFAADNACAGLPDEVRTRTYAATVTLTSRRGEPANSRFDVTVRGGTFVEGYNSFTIGVVGDYVKSDIGDWGHGAPGLVEQIAPNTYLTVGGAIATSVVDPSTIAGSFVGAFERCELTSEWGSRYSCDGGAVSHGRCFSQYHGFTLRRR